MVSLNITHSLHSSAIFYRTFPTFLYFICVFLSGIMYKLFLQKKIGQQFKRLFHCCNSIFFIHQQIQFQLVICHFNKVSIIKDNVASCITVLFVQIHMETSAILAFLKEMVTAEGINNKSEWNPGKVVSRGVVAAIQMRIVPVIQCSYRGET